MINKKMLLGATAAGFLLSPFALQAARVWVLTTKVTAY